MKKTSIITLLLAGCLNGIQAQTDATKYITNPSFESNGTKGWVASELNTQTNSDFKVKAGTTYIEKWVSASNSVGNASVKQVISLPVGKYTLTVAAQNYKQSATTTKCTGAYIYAGANQTPVYAPADYTVDFENLNGEVEIGFVAKGATGNWLAVDNFRLTKTGDVDITSIKDELQKTVKSAETLQVEGMDSRVAQMLSDALSTADAALKGDDADAVVSALKSLNVVMPKAELAGKLANATAGTGIAPKVTMTNKYVPTGATEALMRATMTGSNILERGVCWSTSHNPTVLDDRTTDYWTLNGNIYHVTGLKVATVYYLRPYVMNKTYQVAYGDEVKIVTHPQGSCVGTWDEGAPTAEANARCRDAIQQTIEYFNEWTGIKGFTLSGHYGAQTPTADCSYGGWMRIGPNAGNQAIGTVIHETGHGVGVGTSARYADPNLHSWKWFGRETAEMYSFLENKEANPFTSDFCMVGDGTHAWGASASYDWFVNGADKDKHVALQYAGGCCLLYAMFVDGLCPTTAYKNGLPGYTYNFDETKKYYIMCKDADRGLGNGLVYMRGASSIGWKPMLADNVEISDSAAWYIDYEPLYGMYNLRNASNKQRYLTHAANGAQVALKTFTSSTKVANTERFQLMPDRKDVTVGEGSNAIKTHGYWFTWEDNGSLKAMGADKEFSTTLKTGIIAQSAFDFSDAATKQHWIIISEDELPDFIATLPTAIRDVQSADGNEGVETGVYGIDGQRQAGVKRGISIVRYSNGKTKKILTK